MNDMTDSPANDLLGLTAEIVAAHVANNSVSMNDLGSLITQVHATLSTLGTAPAATPAAELKAPAVPIKKSITPDFLFSLEDGKKVKMLKRHLMTAHGMTPDQYRAKWGLPRDYPMVAPSYAARRSELAKSFGLGVGAKGRPSAAIPAKATKVGKRAVA
jgi:predicted transcriptional regulator